MDYQPAGLVHCATRSMNSWMAFSTLELVDALDKLDDVDDAVSILFEGRSELEEVFGVKAQQYQKVLDLRPAQGPLYLPRGDLPVAVFVDFLEQAQQMQQISLIAGLLLTNQHGAVPLGHLDGAVHEHACHNVQHGEDRKKDENQENGEVEHAHFLQRAGNLAPADASRHGLEQGVHRLPQSAVVPLNWGVVPSRFLVLQPVRRRLGEHHSDRVEQHQEEDKEPEEG
mmetsp:Transcript_59936/g.171981  ORF Transcript_59936/g.171981 Transcript_59936/m.171981 type:complete len:227 (-) Transcript_59936:997-1677(-)